MASTMLDARVRGERRTVEISGAFAGGHVPQEHRAADRANRRLAENQSRRRQVVVAMCKRCDRTLTQAFPSEEVALRAIRFRVARGTNHRCR
jgi:hypothetical protein